MVVAEGVECGQLPGGGMSHLQEELPIELNGRDCFVYLRIYSYIFVYRDP